jgi:acyl-CoA synthetase (AMP-forming)/AMP-acid ligase II
MRIEQSLHFAGIRTCRIDAGRFSDASARRAVLFEVDVQANERGRLEAASAGRSSKTIVSSGRLLTGTKVEIVDPDTCKRCSQDEVGEVWVASPSVSYLSIQD